MKRFWAWLRRITAPRPSQDGWAKLPSARERGRDSQYPRYDEFSGPGF